MDAATYLVPRSRIEQQRLLHELEREIADYRAVTQAADSRQRELLGKLVATIAHQV
jgi:hypothetical protein